MTQSTAVPQRTGRARLPLILLALMIIGYAGFFSAYSLQQHATLNTFASTLSSVDQPLWNTTRGRFLERTVGATQAPRTAEHLEVILLPLALTYLAWSDPRLLLIIQSLALAIGALPVFWIARRSFTGVTGQTGPADTRRAEWIALAFAASYLLFPTLGAANIAGFHVDALAVAPLLFAFWYGTERRWRAMWAWAILVMLVKETLPTLTAMLGLYLIFADPGFRDAWRGPARPGSLGAKVRSTLTSPGVRHGLALFAVSVVWHLTATFLIVAPLARQYYGTDGPIYFETIPSLGPGLAAWLGGALALLREPARLAYLAALFGAVGWLALLGPGALALGLPLLAANVLSTDPMQYSGVQASSAMLAGVFVVAAIVGARRLQRFGERQLTFRFTPFFTNATLVSALVVGWLLFSSIGAQMDRGWTPLARRFSWPQATARPEALRRLVSQVPADAAVSATPAVHPHLAHREKIYVYPEMGDATFVLVDVAGETGMPSDELKASVEQLLGGGFGIIDAADGLILLGQGSTVKALPDDFYRFARASDPQPQIPVGAEFGPSLQLTGYDVIDNARERLTRFRFYFEVTGQLPADLQIEYEARSASGTPVDDGATRPLPALTWYTPRKWKAGETVALETAPAFLPRSFAPVLKVASGGRIQPAQVLPAPAAQPSSPFAPQPVPQPYAEVASDGALRLPAMARRNGLLELWEGPLYPVETAEASFGGDEWTVRLREWSAPLSARPGGAFPVLLYWQAVQPAPKNYEVSLQMRDATGRIVGQENGAPTWFVDRPTTQWREDKDGLAGGIDAHTFLVPADLEPGQYQVVAAWYDPETGKRLPRTLGSGITGSTGAGGNAQGDEYVLGVITIDPSAGPRPDTTCLMAKEACASLE